MIYVRIAADLRAGDGGKVYPEGVHSFKTSNNVPSMMRYCADVMFEIQPNGLVYYYKNRFGKALPEDELTFVVLQAQPH